MEDLAEVITAAEFHPTDCSSLVNTLANKLNISFCFRSTVHQKEPFVFVICAIELFVIIMLNVSIVYLYFVNKQKFRIRRARGAKQPKFFLRNYWNDFGRQVQSFRAISSVT